MQNIKASASSTALAIPVFATTFLVSGLLITCISVISAGIATVLNRKHSMLKTHQFLHPCTTNDWSCAQDTKLYTGGSPEQCSGLSYNSLLSRGTKIENLFVPSYLALASLRMVIVAFLFCCSYTPHIIQTRNPPFKTC